MKIMFIDPVFGISGDMCIAALIHAGYPFERFINTIKKIPKTIPKIEPELIKQDVFEGIHLNIEDTKVHFTIKEMENIINRIELNEKIKSDAKGMLEILINAESTVHRVSKDELHFHELSNIDTLIDLIGIADGINFFGIDTVFCGPVPCGTGTIKTSHGIIPNPPPVTLEILKGLKIVFYDEPLELTTPTGAAVVRYYAHKNHSVPSMTIEKTGYGIGTYKSQKPDILRIFIGESEAQQISDNIWVIETDIDDMNMEYFPSAVERLRNKGAIDCVFFPVYMKKGRMGVRLSVLVREENLEDVKDAVFKETSTFGIRLRRDKREVLKRDIKTVETPFGSIRVKYGYNTKGECIKSHIEFEDVKTIGDQKDIPYKDLYDQIKKGLP